MPASGSDRDAVRVELRRVAERWQQLPLGHASSRMPVVRSAMQRLADAVARAEGRAAVEVADLGPGVVVDQLTVLVHDALAVGDSVGLDVGLDVAGELARLRRAVS